MKLNLDYLDTMEENKFDDPGMSRKPWDNKDYLESVRKINAQNDGTFTCPRCGADTKILDLKRRIKGCTNCGWKNK